MRTRLVAGWLMLGACVALPARLGADGPKTRYERVLAEEESLSLGRRPSPLSQIRHVVAAYEAVVRRYPTSGYSDNALWQAAELSLRANKIYRSDLDRETAVRMLKWLVDQYPTSSLHDKAKTLLRQTRAAETTVASATRTAPARVAPTATPTLNVVSMPVAPPPTPASAAPASPEEYVNDAAIRAVTLKSVKRTVVDDLVRVTLEFDGEVTYSQERID